MRLKKILMLTIGFLALILLTSCNSKTKDDLENIYSSYLDFKTEVENQANTLSNDEKTIRAFKNNVDLNFNENPLFELNKYYDIQGNPKNPKDKTLRDTVAYQRFLGHLSFYSTIGEFQGKPYLITIVKIFEKNPFEYIGINQLYAPLKLLKDKLELPQNKKVLIIDPGKNIVDLNSLKTYKYGNYSENLTYLIREASLLEEKEENIELSDKEIEGKYLFKTGDGFVIAIQTD